MTAILDSLPVRRVRAALAAAGVRELLHERPAEATAFAREHGVDPAALARVHLYRIGLAPVMVITAGDRRVDEAALPAAFGLEGEVRPLSAGECEELTGFPPDGVAPVATARPLPVAVDPSLARFPRLFLPAGHPRVVMELTYDELLRLTGGRPAAAVAV